MHPLSRIVLAARPVPSPGARRRVRLPDLEEAVDEVRHRWPEVWLLPPRRLDGCWLGILEHPEHAFDLAVGLREEAWPAPVECVVTAVATGRNEHRRDAVWERARLRSQEVFAGGDGRRDWFRLDLPGRTRAEVELVHALARLHAALVADWTDTRARAVRSYRRHGRQKDVARELGVSQQAVSQLLKGARLKDLLQAEDAMRTWLRGARRPGLWALTRRSGGPGQQSSPPAG